MINPFDAALRELREMNEAILHKLDALIQRLDTLIHVTSNDRYGDGK